MNKIKSITPNIFCNWKFLINNSIVKYGENKTYALNASIFRVQVRGECISFHCTTFEVEPGKNQERS